MCTVTDRIMDISYLFLWQFGLGMPQEDDDEDDESLEAELAALQGRPVQKKKQQKKDGRFSSVTANNFKL